MYIETNWNTLTWLVLEMLVHLTSVSRDILMTLMVVEKKTCSTWINSVDGKGNKMKDSY